MTPATGNDILLDSDIILDSNGKIRMHYVVSYPEPDVGNGTQETMGVTLTSRVKRGVVDPGLPDESGGMVGSQDIVVIPQYYKLVKYNLKGYSGQAALPNKQ